MEQQIAFGTVVSVRVLVAMPGQPLGQVLIVQWGPRVHLLVRLGRYELVGVESMPEPTVPEPEPQPDPFPGPDPEPDPEPEPDVPPVEEPPADAAASRRRSRS